MKLVEARKKEGSNPSPRFMRFKIEPSSAPPPAPPAVQPAPPIERTREGWLTAALREMAAWFPEHEHPVPEKTAVSCGFPSIRALSSKNRRIGEAWSEEASEGGVRELFVSPVLSDPVEVLAVLLHEMIHASVGNEHGHKGPFKTVARALGLEGKLTATVPGEALKVRLNEVAGKLGAYPHRKLDSLLSGRKKQTTRLLKCECPQCGYTCRVTAKWIDSVGAPICPADKVPMIAPDGDDGENEDGE